MSPRELTEVLAIGIVVVFWIMKGKKTVGTFVILFVGCIAIHFMLSDPFASVVGFYTHSPLQNQPFLSAVTAQVTPVVHAVARHTVHAIATPGKTTLPVQHVTTSPTHPVTPSGSTWTPEGTLALIVIGLLTVGGAALSFITKARKYARRVGLSQERIQ